MVRLVMILLGVDYLRSRWRGLMIAGWLGVLAGLIVFIDALDDAIYFPLHPFAFLLLVEGLATLMVAHTGIGGQRTLRYVKGGAFSLAAVLILSGQHHGHFILSMIFGTPTSYVGSGQRMALTQCRRKVENQIALPAHLDFGQTQPSGQLPQFGSEFACRRCGGTRFAPRAMNQQA